MAKLHRLREGALGSLSLERLDTLGQRVLT